MFATDQAALDHLAAVIFSQGFALDVLFEDGDVIARNLVSPSALFEAVTCTADPVKLVLRRDAERLGVFLVLLQDDPDCIVVDHSDNVLCNSIFKSWAVVADAPAPTAPALSLDAIASLRVEVSR